MVEVRWPRWAPTDCADATLGGQERVEFGARDAIKALQFQIPVLGDSFR
jgi:hypothetical protein